MIFHYVITLFFSLAVLLVAQTAPPSNEGDALARFPITLQQPEEIGKIDIQFVVVGDPGNAAASITLEWKPYYVGGVDQCYKIGSSQITVQQYYTFLKAVATTRDQYKLYHQSMSHLIKRIANKDGTYSYFLKNDEVASLSMTDASWLDAARFCNWLHHDQPCGPEGSMTTEQGAYTLNGASVFENTAEGAYCAPNVEAKFFLPTADQWVKAFYYKGGGLDAGYWNTPFNQSPENNDAPKYGVYGASILDGNIKEWTGTLCVRGMSEYHPLCYYVVGAGKLGEWTREECTKGQKDLGFRVAAPISAEVNLEKK